jgi:hypothetical protein
MSGEGVAEVATGFAWALAGLFGVALAHKCRILARGTAHEEPVLAVWPLSRRPTLAVALAVVGELAILVGLLLEPLWGLLGAVVAVGVYAQLLRSLDADAPCRCFGAAEGSSAGSAVVRNVGIVAAAAVGAVALALDGSPVAYPYAASATVVIWAAASAGVALRRFERHSFERGETWRS